MKQEEIQRLTTDKLAELCQEHTYHFKKGAESDGRYCFELLRRAAFEMPDAWEKVYKHWWPFIEHKVSIQLSGDLADVEDIAQDALVRFQRNVLNQEKWPQFQDLASVLSFLNQCITSAVIDYKRKDFRKKHFEKYLEDFADAKPIASSADDLLESNLAHQEYQRQIWGCVIRNCHHPQDYLIAEHSWVYWRKPKEIAHLFPERFSSTEEVMRRKRLLLNRIRRDEKCESSLNR
jgi:DNA-directed RNA polymerase specialized sigma24 family protein